MPNGMALDAPAARAACVVSGSAGAIGGGAIVMGLDQHREQITAEWFASAVKPGAWNPPSAREPEATTPPHGRSLSAVAVA